MHARSLNQIYNIAFAFTQTHSVAFSQSKTIFFFSMLNATMMRMCMFVQALFEVVVNAVILFLRPLFISPYG